MGWVSAMSMPTLGTVRRVARPRGEIPGPQRKELERRRDARLRAEVLFEDAMREAIKAGGSYREVAKVAGIALSTLQKIVPPRKTM